MITKKLTSVLVIFIAALALAGSIAAQETATYYVFEGGPSTQCWQYMTDGAPNNPGEVLDTLGQGEWAYFEHSDVQPDGNDASYEEYYLICASSGVTHTIEYDLHATGSGGYKVDTEVDIRIDTGGTFDSDSESVGGYEEGCVTASSDMDDSSTHDVINEPLDEGGYVTRNYAKTHEDFCDGTPQVSGYTRFRLYEGETLPTEPTATVSPCPDGFIYEDGECIEPACSGVTCDPGEVCIGGVCVDEDDIGERLGATADCLNNDPDMNDPTWWSTVGTWSNGWVSLYGGESVRYVGLDSIQGSYQLTVRGRSCSSTALTHPMYNDPEYTINWYIDGDCQWYEAQYFISYGELSSVNLGVLVDESFFSEVFGVDIGYICLEYIDMSTPTSTPTQTPIPSPTPTRTCLNPDYGLRMPSAWTFMDGAYHDSGALGRIFFPPGSAAQIGMDIPAGRYKVQIQAKTAYNGNGIQVNYGDGYVIQTLYGDNTLHTYHQYIDVETPSAIMTVLVPGNNTGDVILYDLCIYDDGSTLPTATATPEPTQTPGGATATATTEATATPGSSGPDVCINDAPTLDGGGWQVSGSGSSISGGVATVVPGGTLYDTITEDNPEKDYYVHIVIDSDTEQQGILNWRDNRQPFWVPGGGYSQVTLFVPRSTTTQQLAPMSEMYDTGEDGGLFVSPLALPELIFVSPIQPPERQLAAGNILVIENPTGNANNFSISSVCITEDYGGDSGDPWYEVDVLHPVCDRDYVLQTQYSEYHPAVKLGPAQKAGMPVHAILPGVVAMHGDWLSFQFGDYTYSGCVVIDHQALLNMTVQSLYCGLGEFTVPDSNYVKSGDLLGYVTADDYELLFALQVEDAWVDPDDYLETYVDCLPYAVVSDPVPACAADDGNELIPPRFNETFPAWSDVLGDFLPWLAKQLYDLVGYPILCALVPLFNAVNNMLVVVANALLTALTPVFIFLYRISKLFEYVLTQLRALVMRLMGVMTQILDLQVCGRSIISYFVQAIGAASDGEIDIEGVFEDDLTTFGIIAVAQLLINSRVATYILTPMVVIFIGWASWRLLPWALKQIRRSLGLGEG